MTSPNETMTYYRKYYNQPSPEGVRALDMMRGLAAGADVSVTVVRDEWINGRRRRSAVDNDPGAPYIRIWNRWWSDGTVAEVTEHYAEVAEATWMVRDEGAHWGSGSSRHVTVYIGPGTEANLEMDLLALLRCPA